MRGFARLRRYEACPIMNVTLSSFVTSLYFLRSAGSRGFDAPPRGLFRKTWSPFALSSSWACLAAWANPLVLLMWAPVIICDSLILFNIR